MVSREIKDCDKEGKKGGIDILFWGRADLGYSRNRILRNLLVQLGVRIESFRPKFSGLADLEARFRDGRIPDLVWVPCFRQRDIAAAARYCRRQQVPLVIDPLISAYDKQVFERRKIKPGTWRAQRLLAWEKALFALADLVLADTWAHAEFFQRELGVPERKLVVVPVGAEEELFIPQGRPCKKAKERSEVLFFGSFIPLQGPETIVEAARIYQGPSVHWTLLGEGPLLARCRALAAELPNLSFEPWLPYEELPGRIGRADILLGIFGATPKALRVIPNKVYQASACARPLITLGSKAYPRELLEDGESGFTWVTPDSPRDLAGAVARLAGNEQALENAGWNARASYERWFGLNRLQGQLEMALSRLGMLR